MNDPAPTGLRPEVLIQAQALTRTVLDEVARAYVGNPEIPERILVAMLARGHCLLEGVPGVAK